VVNTKQQNQRFGKSGSGRRDNVRKVYVTLAGQELNPCEAAIMAVIK
jgi:ribosomal protein L23